MNATVCIIGAGELGAAVADALARREPVARVVLIDDAASVASGKALDIQQSGAIARFHTRLEGSNDLSRVTGCAACVVADRTGRPSTEWQGDEALALLKRLAPFLGDVPIVLAGTSQAAVIPLAVLEAGVRRERLLGSAPEALAHATRAIVAMWPAIVIATTGVIIGTLLGEKMLARVAEHRFRTVVGVLLLILGVSFLVG